ncbi:probable ATP-dependent RNA helicase DDX27 [Cimex lectularius]|uniref:RNA helicase n=1 Tax=Cimex lectularius TaxID=79782 RepID=A0A8I6TF62_CIMLE|nr:probable ATP-dependent RNA helicase DDX27 [Cimex lectularius]
MVIQDLIKTIGDEDDVPDFSDKSEDEEEENFQPKKKKIKKSKDFDDKFTFVSSVADYNKDTWNDLSKYIKKGVSTKTDDKIKRERNKLIKEEKNGNQIDEGCDEDGELGSDAEHDEEVKTDSDLSDDELQKDNIRLKEKLVGKKKRKKLKSLGLDDEPKEIEFEERNFEEAVNFYEMNLSRPLLKALAAVGFVQPTPIQSATIPPALEGRDICACAPTGTGKTAAYMLPTLERLIYRPSTTSSVTRVLVLVPTRELGVQVYQVTRQLCQFTRIDVGLSVGGLDLKVQESTLRKSPDIVIATPGRLIDHLKNTPSFSLDNVEVLILDEADRMLDEYFQEQMTEIIKECARTRQTLLFSATMTEEVSALAAVSLTKPVKVFVNDNRTVAENLRQEFIKIRKDREGDREVILASLMCRTFRDHAMVFVQTKKQAHRLYILLGLLGLKAGELHGDMTQAQRLEALRKFREEEVDVLVATDVAARGLDIRGVKTVVNFILPATMEQYIHRVGRTARAGKSGVSVSLAGERERPLVKEIVKSVRHPVRARTIPTEIISKFKKKVNALEERINTILQEEWEEKALRKAELQMAKTEKILSQDDSEKRMWFQTGKERREEKERLRLEEIPKFQKGKPKNKEVEKVKKGRAQRRKKKGETTSEERVEREMQKLALYQARLAKRNRKPKKMNTIYDKPEVKRAKINKTKKSVFDSDLTDVSKKGVKKLRYETTKHQKELKYGKKDEKGPKNKGKGTNNMRNKGRKK